MEESKEMLPKTFYYRLDKESRQGRGKNSYQLVHMIDDVPHVLGNFEEFPRLEKFVRGNFAAAQLAELPGEIAANKLSSLDVDHIYLPLEGKAPRDLSWGMSRKKAARLEQVEGGGHILIKKESMFGFEVNIQLGFDEWAHCGLEYIAYSSSHKGFLENMEEELRQTRGVPEQVVDYHGLDRQLQADEIKNEEILIRYIKDPGANEFNQFVNNIRGLAFRCAWKWCMDSTACLMYTKRPDSPGMRNRNNLPYVVEYWPAMLFEFYQERFAELYLPT
jgi:hypothetical protein